MPAWAFVQGFCLLLILGCLPGGGGGGNGSGSGDSGDDGTTSETFTLSASVSGLQPGFPLTVALDDGTDVTATANGSATVQADLETGSSYALTLEPHPLQRCDSSGLSGTVDGSDITVTITCEFLVFFAGAGSSNNFELWVTDGTATGTRLVKELRNDGSSNPGWFTFYDGYLYFAASPEGCCNPLLYRYDGADSPEVVILEDDTELTFYGVENLLVHQSKLWFSGNVDETAGLFYIDGDADPEYVGGSSLEMELFVGMGGNLYFVGTSSEHSELYRADTETIDNLELNTESETEFWSLAAYDSALYFGADLNGDEDVQLWRYNGSGVPVEYVLDESGSSNPRNFAIYDGALYFSARDAENGGELWRFDGQEEAPHRVTDEFTNSTSNRPAYLTVAGGSLFFEADDGEAKLWSYTTGGTAMKLAGGAADLGTPFTLDPNRADVFDVVNGYLLFSASDAGRRKLYRHDLETGETEQVGDSCAECNDVDHPPE